jgi:hypothetical protein
VAWRRLPQLDPMTLGVGDPREPAVLVLVTLVSDLYALCSEPRDQPIQIVHAVVQHESWRARSEVGRVFLEEGPDRGTDAIGIVTIAPFENGPTVLFDRDTEMSAVPIGECV